MGVVGPEKSLNRVLVFAKRKLTQAKKKWAVVYGPAAALVQTCARIGWQVVDATNLITDEGEHLRLKLDPPIVVVNRCIEAVKR